MCNMFFFLEVFCCLFCRMGFSSYEWLLKYCKFKYGEILLKYVLDVKMCKLKCLNL